MARVRAAAASALVLLMTGSSAALADAHLPQRSGLPAGPLPWGSTTRGSPLGGDVLIADSGAHRLLLVTPGGQVIWQYPRSGGPSPLGYMDDAFFTPSYDGIVTNEEDANAIAIVGFRSDQVVWTYGRPGVAGAAPGLLHTPDDALLQETASGPQVTLADIANDRVLTISVNTGTVVSQYGQTGVDRNNPPTYLASPNGAFPGPGGSLLITQIGGDSASLISASGQLIYNIHFPAPLTYPSDANFTPSGKIIVTFYSRPGAVAEFAPTGQLLWLYRPLSGAGALNHPSLARLLATGMVLVSDDLNDRVVVIDPTTNAIVWQYGHTGEPGSTAGYLVQPDGFDLLPAGVVPGACPAPQLRAGPKQVECGARSQNSP